MCWDVKHRNTMFAGLCNFEPAVYNTRIRYLFAVARTSISPICRGANGLQ